MLGGGAIGSCLGADLTDAGHEVTIIDQWPQHVEAMKTRGLRIRLPDGDFDIAIDARHLCELAALNPEFEMVLLAVKSYDTRWMVEPIRPYLAEDGVLVGIQNSMNDDTIADIVGRERTVGCVVELSGETYTPGVVQRDTPRAGTWFAIGELDGTTTSRLNEIKAILDNVGTVDVTGNIYGAKWTKLVVNSMTMGPYSLLGIKNWDAVELPGMIEISVAIGRESIAVGRALDHRMEPVFGLSADDFAGSSDEVLVTMIKTLTRHVGRNATTAPIHDHLKGRRSEIEFINGLVAHRGREVGVPTPHNDVIVEFDRRINRGELAMDASNFALLRDAVSKIA